MNDPKRSTHPAPVVAARIARWLLLPLSWLALQAQAVQIELTPPAGSVAFGDDVVVLPNGNIVVRDDQASIPASKAGAVHLYSPTGALISTLRGSSANDQIGNWGIRVLDNGHFLVLSRDWDNGAIVDAGAATWCSGTTGCAGTVSAANSLVGTSAGDRVGFALTLRNGNYLVLSSSWKHGADYAGAVTWCSGNGGCSGPVGPANSLIGGAADYVGSGGLALANGNAVIASSSFDNGAASNAGAVTWIDGDSGLVGTVSATNSLVGTSAGDQLGNGGLVALSNGHYVIVSHWFDNGAATDAGAVTWGNGFAAMSGTVNASNSILGASGGDFIGSSRVLALADGNYVINSGRADINGVTDAGASTWVNGSGPATGTVNAANSIHGSTAMDRVAEEGAVLLANGHYVVQSRQWDNAGVVNAGAVTWGNRSGGTVGAVGTANSRVGSTANDGVGYVFPLGNGNYVISGPSWDHGAVVDAGMASWCNGGAPCTGAVSVANALVGVSGSPVDGRIIALANGHYVVTSTRWDNGPILDVGAVTWASGSSGRVGTVGAANSLIGASAGDAIGQYLAPLPNGDVVIASPDFDNGATADVGAIARRSGVAMFTGTLSAANALVGALAGDRLGSDNLVALADGRAVVQSAEVDDGAATDVGATLLLPLAGLTGTPPAANQVVGSISGEGTAQYFGYDTGRGQLVVGHGPANRVTLLNLVPDERQLFKNGFE